MKEEINFRVSVFIICILSFSSIYLVSRVLASVEYPNVWDTDFNQKTHNKSDGTLADLSLKYSTTTKTGIPVNISISLCNGNKPSTGICFGQGEGVTLNKKVDNIDVFDLVSTSNLIRVGLVLNNNDKESYYNVDADFGTHEYTNAEYDEMLNVALSSFKSKLNSGINVANSERYFTGNILNISSLMKFLFGNYKTISNGDSYSDWTPNDSELSKLNDLNISPESQEYPWRVFAFATSSKTNEFILLTYATDCGSHPCGAIIGGYRFTKEGSKGWKLNENNSVMGNVGQFGYPGGDAVPINLGSKITGFKVESGFTAQGETLSFVSIYAPLKGDFKEVLPVFQTGRSNENPGPNSPEYSYYSSIAFTRQDNSNWSNITITSKGTDLRTVSNRPESVLPVDEKHQFMFSNDKYVEFYPD